MGLSNQNERGLKKLSYADVVRFNILTGANSIPIKIKRNFHDPPLFKQDGARLSSAPRFSSDNCIFFHSWHNAIHHLSQTRLNFRSSNEAKSSNQAKFTYPINSNIRIANGPNSSGKFVGSPQRFMQSTRLI